MGVTSGTTHTRSAESDRVSAQLVAELASRIGSLGVEPADVAGNLDEVSVRVSRGSSTARTMRSIPWGGKLTPLQRRGG